MFVVTPSCRTETPDATVAFAVSTEHRLNAPVVLVPGIAVGARRPSPALTAVTKPFDCAATPALETTAQLLPNWRSLIITASARPPDGSCVLARNLSVVTLVCR